MIYLEFKTRAQQVLSICGNSFKTDGKHCQVCKAVIKAKGGYFEESKIYLDLFNYFWGLLHDSVCYFIVLMSSLLFFNVEKSKNKEKPLIE